MISVAMTTYNGEKYILSQLESIRSQTLLADEVIISDDNSTDNTCEIIQNFIKKYKLNNWTLIKNKENKGFVKNFINTICRTKGDIIFLSDQDDIFKKDKFEKSLNFFLKNPKCKVLNTDFDYIDEYGIKRKSFRILKRKNMTYQLTFNRFLYLSSFPGFSMSFTKDVRELIKNIDNIDDIYGHDILINLLGIHLDGCYVLGEVLNHYRTHSSNTSGVGQQMNNSILNTRVEQKKKELSEYHLMEKICEKNHLNNIKFEFLKKRENVLKERIEALEGRKLIKAILIYIFRRNIYPSFTLKGDIYIMLKNMF